jgi:surface carbohydrate biosynthesis protein
MNNSGKVLLNRIRRLSQITWHGREICDVLIYDEEGSDFILRCLPANLEVQILHIRKGLPLIKSYKFLFLLFSKIRKYGVSETSLLATILQIWNPKIIITFIDNSPALGKLKAKFPDLEYISVQNGSRWDLSRLGTQPLSFGRYFTFGAVEEEILASGPHTAERLHPIGSLRAGFFLENHQVLTTNLYDLCFISGFTPLKSSYLDTWDDSMTNAYHRIDKELFNLVATYALSNDLSLCVALRYSEDHLEHADERSYYSFPDADRFHFIPQSGYSSYESIAASRVSVTSSSSLGYEGLGLGRKVVFAKDVKELAELLLQGTWHENYMTKYLPPLLRLLSLDPEEFSTKVTQVLNMTEGVFSEYSKEARFKYMNLDFENLPHMLVQNEITDIIHKLITRVDSF